ncbi:UDP-N-acetylglucosamine 1-carboxyvinyltransferase [Candidatus Marinamargulisbacteria bacterium SCGC AAA071-K20]|nr:UDP-N-acetylglucosamine 1-carboxyvinyltransferase [Candidatus Marinamargulisbacteria bacterium SCGC AAA071-K20]
MSRLTIEGGFPLKGTVQVSGAKNSVLPILAACIMLDGETVLTNVPYLNDVSIMVRMLSALGVRAEYYHHNKIKIWNKGKLRHMAPYDLVTSMRASFFVAGPLLAKTGLAKVPLPGGCSIGTRPVDIHLKGFEALGAKVSIEHGFVSMQADKLKGGPVPLGFPSVGATENLMMAASLAEGDTVIQNAAKEPEITDLANLLIQAGAKIEGVGTSTIHITGVKTLQGLASYPIIPDRIEAGTLIIAAALCDDEVRVEGVVPGHIESVLYKLKQCGVNFTVEENAVVVKPRKRNLTAVDIETAPYPGFPTDMQAQMMTLLTIAEGKSIIKEKIFENRFMHARELMRMGAKIKIDEHTATITGVKNLSGAEVKITDLRAGAALILAGLVAKGYTNVYGLHHLNRGYYQLDQKLKELGAKSFK